MSLVHNSILKDLLQKEKDWTEILFLTQSYDMALDDLNAYTFFSLILSANTYLLFYT